MGSGDRRTWGQGIWGDRIWGQRTGGHRVRGYGVCEYSARSSMSGAIGGGSMLLKGTATTQKQATKREKS